MPERLKRCCRCNKLKPLSEFYEMEIADRITIQRQGKCKMCVSRQQAAEASRKRRADLARKIRRDL